MRARMVNSDSVSRLVRQLIIAGLALAVISAIPTANVLRAEDPFTEDTFDVEIDQLLATEINHNYFMIEGVISASDLSAVSIDFTGGSSVSPDTTGYFVAYFNLQSGSVVDVEATDNTSTATASVTLEGFGV